MKNLVCVNDLKVKEIRGLLEVGIFLKKEKKFPSVLNGKTLCLLFEKPSLRTRVSFQVAISKLGGQSFYMGPNEVGLGAREAIKDAARTLSGFVDGVVMRTFAYNNILEFVKYSKVPVINALTDYNHPCQALGDFMTITELFKNTRGVRIVYLGDANNVCTSLMFTAASLGSDLCVCTPQGFGPSRKIMRGVKEVSSKSGSSITLSFSPREAVKGADVIYTDVWASMGKEDELPERKGIFASFQVNPNLLKYVGKKKYYVMHCLPAHRGEEITDKVLESKNSVVFRQAQNRLYIQMAVLYKIFGEK